MSTLDLRKPLGVLFLILGVLLAVYGIAVPSAHAQVDAGFNVDLSWGAVMSIFGVFLLLLSWTRKSSSRSSTKGPQCVESPEQTVNALRSR